MHYARRAQALGVTRLRRSSLITLRHDGVVPRGIAARPVGVDLYGHLAACRDRESTEAQRRAAGVQPRELWLTKHSTERDRPLGGDRNQWCDLVSAAGSRETGPSLHLPLLGPLRWFGRTGGSCWLSSRLKRHPQVGSSSHPMISDYHASVALPLIKSPHAAAAWRAYDDDPTSTPMTLSGLLVVLVRARCLTWCKTVSSLAGRPRRDKSRSAGPPPAACPTA